MQYESVTAFVAEVCALPEASQNLLMDMARSQRQQTELAVRRVAKAADARCDEWLLRHLRERQLISCGDQVWGLPNPQALRELAGV